MKPRKTTNAADRLAERLLGPLIKAGRARPALYTEIADEMTARTGIKHFRQMVACWLHPNHEQRVEPRLGAGLLLAEVGTKIDRKARKTHKP
jgi:hypothetical protein